MKTRRIIVVDDDRSIRTLVRICLEQEGYVVDEAAGGADALGRIRGTTPDLMLLDLAMPGMDGMALLAEMRKLGAQCPTRAIVITANGSINAAFDALRLGASDFLEKPFTPDDLRRSVTGVLSDAPPVDGAYDQTLRQVRRALRAGQLALAERRLMSAGAIAADSPAFLNLAGVVHESYGRIDCARRFYERAAARDRGYAPAHENIERLGELPRLGKTSRKVALGPDRASKRAAQDVNTGVTS